MPALAAPIQDETAEAIVLTNRVVIEIHTCSFRVTRGYTFAAVLADETAFWRDETSANPDVEIFRALRPGLANIPGAMLLNASSPYRKAGVLHATFARHFGKDDARVLVWRGTTLEMNPGLDPEIVAAAYEDDPESAAAEYGAEFRGDIADFVSREVVDACTIRGRVGLLVLSGRGDLLVGRHARTLRRPVIHRCRPQPSPTRRPSCSGSTRLSVPSSRPSR